MKKSFYLHGDQKRHKDVDESLNMKITMCDQLYVKRAPTTLFYLYNSADFYSSLDIAQSAISPVLQIRG